MGGIGLGLSPVSSLASVWTPKRLPGLLLWLAADYGLPQIGPAAQLTIASSESLSIADNAALSTGDVDSWLAAWGYMDAIVGGQFYLLAGKSSSTTASHEYGFQVNGGTA